MIELFSKESAIKKPNTVDQVAAVALLFASDAGRNMTASMFAIDGGTLPY
jgi:enoyl-[acyl-carrier-protein] reductase (NADH)